MAGRTVRRMVRPAFAVAVVMLLAAACATTKGGSSGGGGEKSGKQVIGLLLPETKTTRYEQQDKPNFERKVKELCPSCRVIYANANQDADKQQQQAEALLDAMRSAGKSTPSVVMINGSASDSNAGPYKKGAHNVLDAAGVKVAKEYDTPDWSPDKAQSEMEQAITSVGPTGFDGVYVANDGMASG